MEGGETQEDGVIVSGGSDSAAVGNVSSEGAPQDGIPMARQDSADVLGSVASLEERMSTSAARYIVMLCFIAPIQIVIRRDSDSVKLLCPLCKTVVLESVPSTHRTDESFALPPFEL